LRRRARFRRFVFGSDHEAGDVLEENERDAALAAELDEVRALLSRLGEEDAVVSEDPDGEALDAREAVTSVSPYSALNSSKREPSTMRAMISRASVWWRKSSGMSP